MKGIVFTEFLEMLEEQMPLHMVEELIEEAELESGGAYTTVGTYDYNEMLTLVTLLGKKLDKPVEELKNAFGKYLFSTFTTKFPVFFHEDDDAFSVLSRIEDTIHVEVAKLYPDAELPKFDYRFEGDDRMILTYRSSRPFSGLAEGLICGCIAYYGQEIRLEREDNHKDGGYETCFTMTKVKAV